MAQAPTDTVGTADERARRDMHTCHTLRSTVSPPIENPVLNGATCSPVDHRMSELASVDLPTPGLPGGVCVDESSVGMSSLSACHQLGCKSSEET